MEQAAAAHYIRVRTAQGKKDSKSTPSTHHGHKWPASEALKEAEDNLLYVDIIGYVARDRLGLGCSSRLSWKKADLRERRRLMQRKVPKAEERKLKKYQPLILESKQKGWQAWNLPVEVGCWGFAVQSLWKALGLLRISGPAWK